MPIKTRNPYKKSTRGNLKHLTIVVLICGVAFYYSTKVQNKKTSAGKLKKKSSGDGGDSPLITSSLTYPSIPITKDTAKPPFNAAFNPKTIEPCSYIQPNEPKPKEQWSKSIWFPMLHHSFPDNIHRDLINQLTRLSNGGKSFYVSVKNNLRHCVGSTETATCSTGDLPKEKNRSLFYDKYMMFIRNPRTVFPSATNVKNEKYHGLKGQMTKESWKEIRNVWLDKMMDEWIMKIKEWRETDYEDGLYVVYEDLMDVASGPEVVMKIAKLLIEAGFEVEEENNVKCIWMKSIGVDRIEQFYNNGYDYNDYVPGYTKEQQEMMMMKLKGFMDEIGESNRELQSILKRYYDDIRDNTIIEDN